MFGLLGVVLVKGLWLTINKCLWRMMKGGKIRLELLVWALMIQKRPSRIELNKRVGLKLNIWLFWVGKERTNWLRITKFKVFPLFVWLTSLERPTTLVIQVKSILKGELMNLLYRRVRPNLKRKLQLHKTNLLLKMKILVN